MRTDISWLIGGPQGSGVESAANIFSRVCARLGYRIFGKREFYSNIKGEHSYFVVRVSDKKIHSGVSSVTLMVSYDAETIFRHCFEVVPGAAYCTTLILRTSRSTTYTRWMARSRPESDGCFCLQASSRPWHRYLR